MLNMVAKSSLILVAAFFLITIIAFSSLKISFLTINGKATASSESLLYFMSLENRSLQTIIPEYESKSFSKSSLEFFTNINIQDSKTFLISELPGLQASMPKILTAGEGTDFTNLPIESPAPPDFGKWENEEEVPPLAEEKPVEQTKNPVAFIYHTHSRESFLPLLPGLEDPNDAWSKDQNVTLLGSRLGKKLEEKGIKTLVDTSDITGALAKKKMAYWQSYDLSRTYVVDVLQQHQEVKLLFDIHRDSARKNVTTAVIDQQAYAKPMFIVGTGNQNYRKNLQFANFLHKKLEARFPGFSRGVMDKARDMQNNGIYNQDLADHALVIEIGGVDNNLEELNRTVDILAEVISDYYWGEAVEANN